MKRIQPNLRTQLLVVAALSTIPFLGVTIYTANELHSDVQVRLQTHGRDAARTAVMRIDDVLSASRQILSLMPDSPDFSRMLSILPQFLNLGVLSPNGRVLAAAVKQPPGIGYAGRNFVLSCVHSGNFTVGGFLFDPVTGLPGIPLAYPAKNRAGQVTAISFAMLNLSCISHGWDTVLSRLPPGSLLVALDKSDDNLVFRAGGHLTLSSEGPNIFSGQAENIGSGWFTSDWPDGKTRSWYVRRIRNHAKGQPLSLIAVGVRRDVVFSHADMAAFRSLSAIAGSGTVLVFLGWWILERRAVRPLRGVLNTLLALGTGDFSARTRLDRPGGSIGALISAVDSTADALEKNADRQDGLIHSLRASELRYRTLVEISADAIILLDGSLSIVAENEAARNLFSTPGTGSLAGRQVTDLVCPAVRQIATYWLKNRLAETGQIRALEIDIQTSAGACIPVEVSVSGRMLTDERSATIVTVIRDIRERRRAQQEKASLQEQLVQSQRMEAVGTLAGGVAHDFNNLLTVIRGYVEISKFALKEDDPMLSNLREIDSATRRAADVTRQLLLFSRRQKMELTHLDPNDLAENMSKLLQRLIGENIQLRIRKADNLWMVKGDRGSLEQVLMNLAVNARDAMADGGVLSIATSNFSVQEAGQMRGGIPQSCRYVRLTVRDTGVGMTPDTIDHAFEPFFTTKDIGKGTGLGLSVAFGIIKEHGGFIDIESVPNEGTSFHVFLPAVREKRASETVRDERGLPAGNGELIMIVEDDESIRTLTEKVLTENGYRVESVGNAAEARRMFLQCADQLAMMLIDVKLPDGSGARLAHEFAGRQPSVIVTLTSGYTDFTADTEKTLENRGFRYLPKPYSAVGLLTEIQAALSVRQSQVAAHRSLQADPI